jgi:hypothetical protein
MPQVVAALSRAGVKRGEYRLWSAHYNYKAHVCGPKSCGYSPQCDATQWTDRGKPNYDESLLSSGFFSQPKPPAPKPTGKYVITAVDAKGKRHTAVTKWPWIYGHAHFRAKKFGLVSATIHREK